MAVSRFVAKQLGHPTGTFGRLLVRLLNRTNAPLNALVLEALEVQRTDRVLEVGFGGAALLEDIARRTPDGFAAGLELSADMVDAASKRLRASVDTGLIELDQGSVESLPYDDATFDKACTVNTIYFWPDLGAGIRELARVVRPGGRLVLGFSAEEDMRRERFHERGFKIYSLEDLESALLSAGFERSGLTSSKRPTSTLLALAVRRLG